MTNRRGQGYWQSQARLIIQRVHETLPEAATLKERRAALREAKSRAGFTGAYWPGRMWAREAAIYLAKHGADTRQTRALKSQAQLDFEALPRDPVTGRPVI